MIEDVVMFKYNLSVSMSDANLSITNDIRELIILAADEANSRRNASRKGRVFQINNLIDEKHIHICLLSDTEVMPTRALSALSRSMIALDSRGILEGHCYRGCVLSATILESSEEKATALSDVQMLQEITAMLFDRVSLNNREKKLAKDTSEEIRNIVIDYINKKTVSK